MRIVKVVVMLGAFGGLTGAFFGCGSSSRPNAASGEGTANPTSEKCIAEGQSRECKFIVSEVNDVRTCASGSQTCVGGYWSACSGDGRAAPSLLQSVPLSPIANGGLRISAINPATDAGPACANPCDPACTGYNEACGGDGGVEGGADGSITTFPPTTLPACGSALSPSTSSCDCTGLLPLTCGMACNSTTGCQAVARTGKVANFSCNSVTGLCDFKCDTGSVCNVDCNSTGTCSTTCLPGSVCNISCNSVGSCPVNCAVGAVCAINLCNSSNCPLSTIGAGGCTQTPPFELPNIVAPGANAGHENKLLDDPCHPGGSSAACEIGPFGTTRDNGRMASTCQADTYCEPAITSGGMGCCKAFAKGQTHATAQATGDRLSCADTAPDLTIPGVCRTPTGDIAMMICNRGSGSSVGSVWLGSTNPNDAPHNGGTAAAPTCLNIGAANYVCRFDGTIAPGACTVITKNSPLGAGCGGALPNGNSGIMINGPDAPAVVSECTLAVDDAVSAAQPDQPGCANNLHAFGAPGQIPNCLGGYAPTKITEVYTATCAPGQRPKWTTLGWQATTPGTGASRSNVEFYATIEGKDYDGGPLAPVGPKLIGKAWNNPATPQTVPPNYANYIEGPATCRPDTPTTAPTICPKDLANTIGAPPPNGSGPIVLFGDKLTLEIFLNPGPNSNNVPTLSNWWISYTCVDYE